MKAVIIGGSGATGKELVQQLLDDPEYEEVLVLLRRPTFASHQKLKELIVDFSKLERYQDQIQADIAFSCLGSTLKDAGSKKAQWEVDYEYNLKFAQICKANQVPSFVLLSAVGANENSMLFYNKMKGTLEKDIKSLNWDQLIILQPGGLIRPGSTRRAEVTSMKLLHFFNRLGLFRSYAPLPVAQVATAMIRAPKRFPKIIIILPLQLINQLANEKI